MSRSRLFGLPVAAVAAGLVAASCSDGTLPTQSGDQGAGDEASGPQAPSARANAVPADPGGFMCETIDFDNLGLEHGDPITSVTVLGSTLNFTATRNEPAGDVDPTAYNTDYELGDGGCANLLNDTHEDTQILASTGLEPGLTGFCDDCDEMVMMIPDVDFCVDSDDSQGGFFDIAFPAGNWSIPRYDAVDRDDAAPNTILRVGAGLDEVGTTDCPANPACGNGNVVTVETVDHVFQDLAQFENQGSGGIDDIRVCRRCDGRLGDFLWEDLNFNGIQDPGEPGIAGIKVTLTKDGDPGFMVMTTTDAAGNYLFEGLCPGKYFIEYDPTTVPANFLATITNAGPPDVDSNPNPDMTPEFTGFDFEDLTYDFGFVECQECDGGLTRLDLLYNGPSATITVEGDVEFAGGGTSKFVTTGEVMFLVVAAGKDKMKSDVKLKVDGQETKIHTSCSKPIGPGLVVGDYTVVFAVSRNGGVVCPLPPPPDCLECKGGVTELTLQFNGASGSLVEIEDDGDIIYSQILNNGDQFTINGSKDDGKFQKNDLIVFVDGVEDAKIHVSCSQPIGPGAVFGDLTVVQAFSKDNPGVEVCPVPPPPDCLECKGGVTELTLEFTGADGSLVEIDDDGDIIFSQVLNNGDQFTINGSKDDGKFQKNDLKVFVDGAEVAKIHVSCSQEIGPNSVFGPLVVIQAFSKDNPGIEVCPVPPPPDGNGGGDLCETIGKPAMLKLAYTGGSCAAESNSQGDKSDCSDEGALTDPSFFKAGDKDKGTDNDADRFGSGSVAVGGTFIVDAALDGEDKLKSATKVHLCADAACTDRRQFVEIHTSCSAPLVLNDVFGGLELIGYKSETGGTAGDI